MLIRRSHTRYACALLLAALWLGLASPAYAATCTSVANGNWNQQTTWGAAGAGCVGAPGGIPGTGDTVTIQSGYAVTVTASSEAASVTVTAPGANATTLLDVASGQTLTVSGALDINGDTGNRKAEVRISGTGTLTVAGNLTPTTPAAGNAVVNFTGAGTLNIGGNFTTNANTTFTPGTGTVIYNGSGTHTIGTYTYNNLTIEKGGTVSTTAAITVNTNLTVNAGTMNLGGNATVAGNLSVNAGSLNLQTFTANRSAAGGTLTVANNATLFIGGTNSFPSNYTTRTMGASSTVRYNGANQSITSGLTYGHLILEGAAASTKTPAAGAITVAGNFTVQGTATTYAGTSNNPTVNLVGNLLNNGTFNSGTGAFTFNGAVAQTISGNATSLGNLVIDNTSVVGVTAETSLTIGAFDIKASRTFNAGTLNHSISGSFNNSGTFNHNNSTFTFNGTVAQSLTGTTTFYNLTMNNTVGLTINNDVTVSDTLTFTNGKITTGTTTSPEPHPNTLTTLANCADSVTGAGATTGWVVGNLRKSVPAGTSTCVFQVGGTANYSPIVVEFPSGTTAGNLTGAAMPTGSAGHPALSGTDINPTRKVKRFWTLKNNTPTNFFTSYSATFHFNAADIDSGADPLEFIIRRYSPPWPSTMSSDPPSTWSNVTANEAALTSTSSQGTGITGTGDFAIGNSSISAFLREREWVYQRELYYQ